ncbi:MAG: riboflavin synthase [Acidobacteria bacterium]|nr:riboflavin synthase [Acidobacteriota bacterium]
MFTGLIESVGTIVTSTPMKGGVRVRIATSLAPELTLGESLAVNGVCLTVIAHDAETADADIGPETLQVTTLGRLQPGSLVNLERSMRADARFGGHFVQGHVDAVGRIEHLRQDVEFHRLTVSYPAAFAPNLIHRGSIAVDGISLTVAALADATFELMIIPFTMAHTNLRQAAVGTPVNLEFDMVGKYVARTAELARAQAALSDRP